MNLQGEELLAQKFLESQLIILAVGNIYEL
jgi:hypothetical protein